MFFFHSIVNKGLEIVFHLLPVDRNKILFSSFGGQYNDNPKYISELLHFKHPEITIYWIVTSKSNDNDIPEYVNRLKPNTVKYFYIKNRCRVVVDNGAGLYLVNTKKYLLPFYKLLKNHKQINISTWHGNPIKTIGAQIPGNEHWSKNTFFTSSDVLLAGCHYVKNIFEKAFLHSINISLVGTPRTDLLFNKGKHKLLKIKKKLGFPLEKKIVLFAPTYRYSVKDSGVLQMEKINFEVLLKCLSNKFGGDWIFVFRVHNLVIKHLDTDKIVTKYSENVLSGNTFDDMAEYLFVADVLITDYSGSIFDIALTDKPCFLYAHDRLNYISKERGLYMPLEEFPYSFSDTFSELIENIENYNKIDANSKRIEFLGKIGNVEDGKASLRVVQLIEDSLKLN